ncbi:hypothetical protein Tco_0601141 [Tanacetum coccineum]
MLRLEDLNTVGIVAVVESPFQRSRFQGQHHLDGFEPGKVLQSGSSVKSRAILARPANGAVTEQVEAKKVLQREDRNELKPNQWQYSSIIGPRGRTKKISVGGFTINDIESDFKKHFDQLGGITDAAVQMDKQEHDQGKGYSRGPVDYLAARNVVTRPATTPISQYGGGSYADMFSEGANVSGGRPTVSGLSLMLLGLCLML